MSKTKEEQAAYSRGYAAGRRKNEKDEEKWEAVHREIHETTMERRDAFWTATFAAALQGTVTAGGWRQDGKPISSMGDYIALAGRFADAALKERERRRGRGA